MKMLCKKCNEYIPGDSKICCYCGNIINDVDRILHRQNEKKNFINMQRNISNKNKNSFQIINIPKHKKEKKKKRKKNKFIIIPIFLAIFIGSLIITYTILST